LEKVIMAAKRENRQVHERKIWQWLIELMDTLVYMHRGPEPENDRNVLLYWNSVYHRDIKPGNILLKNDYKQSKVVTKMADFGCSNSAHWTHATKRRRPEAISIASALTPGFDPPEFPEYSGAADVWQVALVIACVCTGIMNPRSMHNDKGHRWDKGAPAGRKYSQKLNNILAWCLTEDKKRRPMPLEISKRAKAHYASINLPPDTEPLSIFGRQHGQAAQTPQPVRISGPFSGGQQRNFHDQRPDMQQHAFSDLEVQRMEHRGDRYNNYVRGQRSPMPVTSVNDILHSGGGYPSLSAPRGFIPGFGQGHFPPGFGACGGGYFPDPRHHRRGW
jgi:serine/threonine protein kinase